MKKRISFSWVEAVAEAKAVRERYDRRRETERLFSFREAEPVWEASGAG